MEARTEETVLTKKIKEIGAINNSIRHELPTDDFFLYGSLEPDRWAHYMTVIREQIAAFKEQMYTDIHCHISGYTRLTLEIVKWCRFYGLGFSAYHFDLHKRNYSLQPVFGCREQAPVRHPHIKAKAIGTMPRHEMPVNEYFLPLKAVDPNNLDQYEIIIRETAETIKNEGFNTVDLYITEFYRITLMIVKHCNLLNLNLNAYHYDMDKGIYLLQTVL